VKSGFLLNVVIGEVEMAESFALTCPEDSTYDVIVLP
jgi:hypothetical protein